MHDAEAQARLDAIVQARLNTLAPQGVTYAWLESAEYRRIFAAIVHRFGMGRARPKGDIPVDVTSDNSCPLGADAVRALLRSYVADHQTSVFVLWLYETCVARMTTFASFVRNYDDLWYPSAEDVWITDTGLTWCFEISHEELVSFYRFPG